ncbi:MAG: hypothetical protein AAGM16_13070 [Pseudomonadota bacterium]
MNRHALLFGVLALAVGYAQAVDVDAVPGGNQPTHFEVQHSILSDAFSADYRWSVARVFSGLEDTIVKAIVLPSFENEYALGLKISNDNCEVIYLRSKTSLYRAQTHGVSVGGQNVSLMEYLRQAEAYPIEVSRRSVEREICERFGTAWLDTLERARKQTQSSLELSTDGTGYFVSAVGGRALESGWTQNPPAHSDAGILVASLEQLVQFATEPSKTSADLLVAVESLERFHAR